MKYWIKLDDGERTEAWKKLQSVFPYAFANIECFINDRNIDYFKIDLTYYYKLHCVYLISEKVTDFNLEILKDLSNSENIVALEWHHDCYKFNPANPIEYNEYDE